MPIQIYNGGWGGCGYLDDAFQNYPTRTFADIFPSYEVFRTYQLEDEVPVTDIFANEMTDANLRKLYYLLFAKYGNSHIKLSDENQFVINVFGVIEQFGPTWQKKLSIQKELRDLSIDDARLSEIIANHAYHPSTPPGTDDYGALNKIDTQNRTGRKRDKLSTYGMVLALLEDDFTNRFIERFGFLFITIIEGSGPLWYATETPNIPVEDN